MQLESITLRKISIPFHEPFRISSGEVSVKDAIVVEVKNSAGVIGFGEASPMSGGFYSSETPESTWNYLCEPLVPALLGLRECSHANAIDCINQFSEEPFARAGVEGAMWDLAAREKNIPLYEMLGGSNRKIPSGVGIGLYDTIDELLARVEKFIGEGYVRVKIKIQPGWDVEPLRAIRKKFGGVPLMADANASYTLQAHRAILRSLDEFSLMMIEQPLAKDAFDDAAELQREMQTPVCADESAHSFGALEKIIALGSARIINIKVQRVGGLANARRIAERAMQAGLPCWLGTMPELGIASMQGVHLATHAAFTLPTDVEAGARWYHEDIITPPITIDQDGMIAPTKIIPDYEVIERRTTAVKIFSK